METSYQTMQCTLVETEWKLVLFSFFFIELKKRYAFNIMYFYKRPVTPMGDSLLLIYTGSHSRLNPFNFHVLRLYCKKKRRE